MATDQWDELVEHLVQTTPLPPTAARRVVEEVVAFCGEPADTFVRRRHRELQQSGWANPAIYRRVLGELAGRPVAAPTFSERQIRRIIYG